MDNGIKHDKDIILGVLNRIYYSIIIDIPSVYMNDEDIIERLSNLCPHILAMASRRIKHNKHILKVVQPTANKYIGEILNKQRY